MFKFVMMIEGVEFGDALRILAQKAGVELKKQDPKLKSERQRSYDILEAACRFFERQLGEGMAGKEAGGYILSRGITEESVKKWRLGYAPDAWQGLSDFLLSNGYSYQEAEKAGLALKSNNNNRYFDRFRGRITFPIFDLSSQVIGFGARIFKKNSARADREEAKYINSPATLLYDKSRVLYGLNKAGMEIRKKDGFILVEGYTDVIMAHQAGFSNVVATSGTALTTFQLNILKRYSENLFTAFDMDLAGSSATKRGIDLAQALGFNIKVITMKGGKDPADIVKQNPKDWEESVKNAKSIHDFYFENALAVFDRNTIDGKKSISKLLLPIIKRIPNKIEQSAWIQSLAGKLGVREETVMEELEKVSSEKTETEVAKAEIKPEAKGPKSRKEMLEERLLMLAIKSKANLELLSEGDFKIFTPLACSAFTHFKEKKEICAEGFSESDKDWLNLMFVKTEANTLFNGASERDMREEFESCLASFRKLSFKEKLDGISMEIKKAESENDSKRTEELTREFNSCSKLLSDLEAS